MPQVILASSSPRRQHLLSMLGVEYRVEPSQFDEYAVREADFPSREEYVQAIAAGKILEVAIRCCDPNSDDVVLGGDLVTFVGDTTFHKPRSFEQARESMQQFLNVWHDEVAAVGIWQTGKLEMRVAKSQVFTPPFTSAQMDHYLSIAQPLDKSGGYSIAAAIKTLQRDSDKNVELRGELTTVLGMSVLLTAELLRSHGVPVPVNEHELESRIRKDVFASQA